MFFWVRAARRTCDSDGAAAPRRSSAWGRLRSGRAPSSPARRDTRTPCACRSSPSARTSSSAAIAALAAALRDLARDDAPAPEAVAVPSSARSWHDEPLRVHAGRRLHRHGAARQPARRRPWCRRPGRGAHAGVRALDQPVRDDVPAARPPRPSADYRVRIFTPGGELPFAGHPTLGSCHAWRAGAAAGRSAPGEVVQQCGVGLVRIRQEGAAAAFAAPPLVRGAVSGDDLGAALAALKVPRERFDRCAMAHQRTALARPCCSTRRRRCSRSSPRRRACSRAFAPSASSARIRPEASALSKCAASSAARRSPRIRSREASTPASPSG